MFPFEPNEYLDHYPHVFLSDFQTNNNNIINTSASSSSSSSPLSPYGFFNSPEFHHVDFHHLHPPPHYPQQQQEVLINHVPEAKLEKRVDDDVDDQSLKFTLWKHENDQSEIKWMSSKMRLMRKMKGSDHTSNIKLEEQQQQQASSSLINHDDDHHHQSSCMVNNASHYDHHHHHHPPIRVCADCNTTKTPLWRSGPKGPKSLCNACGIRQRKARRALAAAAENGEKVSPGPEIAAPKMKVKNKEFKKSCRSPTGSRVVRAEASSNDVTVAQKKKNDNLEDFLFKLSKKLAFHRVFQREETDAAILLMALSCSGVHG